MLFRPRLPRGFSDPKIKKAFESKYAANLKKTIVFEEERERLYEFLNANKIHFLPLKGILMNNEYPEYGMREFADNDILFDKRYAKKVKEFFVKDGYEVESYGTGAHDTYLKAPVLNFEMHRTLFTSSENTKDSLAFFRNILQESMVKEGYEHYLNDELYYAYFIAHTHKHFAGGGCGVRSLVDIYLYLKHHELKREILDGALDEMKLKDFEKEISELSFKSLEGKELSKEEEDTLLYIMSSGAYGTLAHHIQNSLKKGSKARYLLRRIFPPLSFYKETHPIAYYSIIGIPLVWASRLLRALFFKRSRIKDEMDALKDQ